MKTSKERINLRFNSAMLDRTIAVLLNNADNKKLVANISKLFSSLDSSYKLDYEKEYRVYLINNLCNMIISKNLMNKEEILSNIQVDGKYYSDCTNLLNILYNSILSMADLQCVDEAVSQQLRYASIERTKDEIVDVINNINAEAYMNLDDEMNHLYDLMNDATTSIRDARKALDECKYDISFSNQDLMQQLQQELINDADNPSSKIKTGIKLLNNMLDGGWEQGRCYVALGTAKGFKSGLLLNAAIWAKKYNDLKPKDPTKQPVILYLTMENDLKETLKRIDGYVFGNGFKANNYTASQINKMLAESNIITPNDKTSTGLEIKFRPNKSITTRDLYGIIDDLDKEGKEVVFLVFDYIKRILPEHPDKRGESRIDLGEVVNELSMLAKIKQIPVLTAHQMNREAFRMIEAEETFEGKAAAASRMGASQTGDSIDVIQNCDMAFIVQRLINESRNNDVVEYSDKYLMFNCIITRGVLPEIPQFQVRFKTGNDLHLVEDVMDDKSQAIVGIGSNFITDTAKYTGQQNRTSVRKISKFGV